MALLEIEGLRVAFGHRETDAPAVDDMSLTVHAGEIVGLIGESGSGKSVAMLAAMGLIEPPGRVSARRLMLNGLDLRCIRGRENRTALRSSVAMIFQDPLGSLDPAYTIGQQLTEVLQARGMRGSLARWERARTLLAQVEIPDPEARLRAYPHQLSGGMCQRVMIAMALAGEPRLLIADEPTTALDVTVQAQILDLLVSLQRSHGMALVLISHDLAVVAQLAQRVVVMYAGQIMEAGTVPTLFEAPRHPYTEALLRALPEYNVKGQRLRSLPGTVPGLFDRPTGCLLSPRCAYARATCREVRPAWTPYRDGQGVRCFHPVEITREIAP